MAYDLLIRGAQLRGAPVLTDIGIVDGKVVQVGPDLPTESAEVIAADGRLVVPGFVDTQFHVGKSFYGRETHRYDYQQAEWDPTADDGAPPRRRHSALADYDIRYPHIIPIAKQWAWKQSYSIESVADRIVEALLMGVANGVMACRMFIDVDNFGGLIELEAALEAKRRMSHLMQLQICAFPQEGIETNPGTDALMRQAMEKGADVVGGHPWVEWTDDACARHVDFCFALAQANNRPIHFLCDDVRSPMARSLELFAVRVIQTESFGRASSSHNGALAAYPEAHAIKVMNLVRQAEMNIVCNSHVNLLGGVTRVHELVDLGVNVSMGQDDIDNFYYPFGKVDPLEWAWSMAHVGAFGYPAGVEQVFDMITVNGARTLELGGYGLSVGSRADLVVLDCRHPREAIQFQSERTDVVFQGRRVAGSHRNRWVAEARS